MNNFDLTKYLADNPLLKEGLAGTPLLGEGLNPQEKDIVDDILSVTEGLSDILDKMKSYAKKGLLTVAIITSVTGQLQAQGQSDLANQVEKAATELSIGSESKPKYGSDFLDLASKAKIGSEKVATDDGFNSERGKKYASLGLNFKPSPVQKKYNKTFNLDGVKYTVNISQSGEKFYKVEYINTETQQVNSDISFYTSFIEPVVYTKPVAKSIYGTSKSDRIQSYINRGYVVKQTTNSGGYSVVIMGNDKGKYVSLTFKNGEFKNKTKN